MNTCQTKLQSNCKLIELTKSEYKTVSGGCPDDASLWYQIGCAIAKFMNATDGNIHRGPRNGYYF